jgi:hypothetical protein
MRRGGSSAVELLPSKQDVAGSNPVPRSRFPAAQATHDWKWRGRGLYKTPAYVVNRFLSLEGSTGAQTSLQRRQPDAEIGAPLLSGSGYLCFTLTSNYQSAA